VQRILARTEHTAGIGQLEPRALPFDRLREDYLDGRYMGDERLVLAAYNSGEGQVDAWISDKGFDVGEDIPFRETHHYVQNVLEAQRTYEELYGRNLYRDSE
jgi:soluble lytic murein transglycosylase-like protein